MGYQNNILETPEDKFWFKDLTIASLPTNWSHLKGFGNVNYHAGREVAETIDKTLSQIIRHKKTPNKKVAMTLGNNPETWVAVRESMAVQHSLHEYGGSEDDANIILGILYRCLKDNTPIPEDVRQIALRGLAKQQKAFKTKNPISQDQAFGLKPTRAHGLNPHCISDEAFDLVYKIVIEQHLSDKKARSEQTDDDWIVIPFKRAVIQVIADKYENESEEGIDTDDDDQWDSLGLDGEDIKGYWKYKNHFDFYKYQALDYVLRDKIINSKSLSYNLTPIQHKAIKKYWKVDMPMKLEFNDRPYLEWVLGRKKDYPDLSSPSKN